MVTPSEEQKDVLLNIKEGKNVWVDACAGSGKSTTILTCARELSELKFIQITFNKQLQMEVQEKINEEELKNIKVYTYHGLAVKYYDSKCHNDTGIRKVLREKAEPSIPIQEFDVLVIDEAQDMTKLYFDLLWNYVINMGNEVQILVLGDEKQALYGFKGADHRFLTMCEYCWRNLPLLKCEEFIYCTLRMSYRITNEMCMFVNNVMLDAPRMRACKEGPSIVYIRRSIYEVKRLYTMINHLIMTKEANYDDFFILCRSLKVSNWSVRMLENMLVENNIPCFIPCNETKDDLDTRVIENKVVFSTFHASKGRQRPYVIVLGFDDSHFTHFAKDKDPNECPNELYVACTRATKKLFVWENTDRKTGTLPFLKMKHYQMISSNYVSFQGVPSGGRLQVESLETSYEVKKYNIQPSELIRFLNENTLDIISPLIEKLFVEIQKEEETVEIPSTHITSEGYCEDVSDLNGIVLPIMFFDYLYGKKEDVMRDMIKQNMKEISKNHHSFLHKKVEELPEKCEDVSDYLYMANILSATQELLYSRLKQIPKDEYNWICDETIQTCFDRLEKTFENEYNRESWKQESYIIYKTNDLDHIEIDRVLSENLKDIDTLYRFSARVDLITDESIWELKCTSQLTLDHKLQLIIYAWLYMVKNKKTKRFYLYNIKTNELLELKSELEELTTIVVEIIKGKYYEPSVLSDEEFKSQFE